MMKNNHQQTIRKASPLQMVLIAAALVSLTMTIPILPSNSINNKAIAQLGSFKEGYEIHLDKDIYNGRYGILVKNLDTGVEVSDFRYTDSGSIRDVVLEGGWISAHNGDSLEACIMDMSSDAMACDTHTAYNDGYLTSFEINMQYAS